jgi:diaminopimelate epimerase
MSDDLRVWKYQGTGNDFVMTLDLDDERPLEGVDVRALCDRRFGIGADGSIRVTRGTDGRRFMDYRNADGTVAEMCGNGIRCVAVFLRDLGEETAPSFEVGTRAGIRRVTLRDDGRVTVNMGEPNFTKAAIPMRGPAWETYRDEPLDLGGGVVVRATAVSMGNPHLVLFLEDDPERFHVSHIGAVLERDERFPEGTNVEFARVGADDIAARVWERGSGETMACGSGACAIVVAAHEAGLAERRSWVRFPGGTLEVERRESGSATLTGPAARVFGTTIDLEGLAEARSR